MADNTQLASMSGGDTIATDELATLNGGAVSGVKVQRVKPVYGEDGDATDVSPASPMPVQVLGEAIEAIEAMRMALQALTRTVGQMQPDTASRMRVAIDAISASLTLATITTVGTVTTVTTVSTLTTLTQLGGNPAYEQIPALMRLGADALRRNITVT